MTVLDLDRLACQLYTGMYVAFCNYTCKIKYMARGCFIKKVSKALVKGEDGTASGNVFGLSTTAYDNPGFSGLQVYMCNIMLLNSHSYYLKYLAYM